MSGRGLPTDCKKQQHKYEHWWSHDTVVGVQTCAPPYHRMVLEQIGRELSGRHSQASLLHSTYTFTSGRNVAFTCWANCLVDKEAAEAVSL